MRSYRLPVRVQLPLYGITATFSRPPSIGVGHTETQLANIAGVAVGIPDSARKMLPLASEAEFMAQEEVTIDMVVSGPHGDEGSQLFESFHERMLQGIWACVHNMSSADGQGTCFEAEMLKVRTRE